MFYYILYGHVFDNNISLFVDRDIMYCIHFIQLFLYIILQYFALNLSTIQIFKIKVELKIHTFVFILFVVFKTGLRRTWKGQRSTQQFMLMLFLRFKHQQLNSVL